MQMSLSIRRNHIKCSGVSDESHRKKFVDFVGVEDKGFVCGSVSVSRAVCHILLSKEVFANAMLHLIEI